MPDDGSGNYSLPAVYRATPNTTIFDYQHNTPLEDVAQALSNRLPVNGAKSMTGNLSFSGAFTVVPGKDGVGGEVVRASQLPAAIAIRFPKTRTALKNIDTATTGEVVLLEPGREGTFVWTAGDFAARIALDTLEGLYIKANAIASNIGAWVRVDIARVDSRWFGLKADGSTNDTAALQAAVTVGAAYRPSGITIYVPTGDILISSPIAVTAPYVRIEGEGQLSTRIVNTSAGLDAITFRNASPGPGNIIFGCGVSKLAIVRQANTTAGRGLWVERGSAFFMDNVVIGEHPFCLVLTGCTNSQFDQIRLYGDTVFTSSVANSACLTIEAASFGSPADIGFSLFFSNYKIGGVVHRKAVNITAGDVIKLDPSGYISGGTEQGLNITPTNNAGYVTALTYAGYVDFAAPTAFAITQTGVITGVVDGIEFVGTFINNPSGSNIGFYCDNNTTRKVTFTGGIIANCNSWGAYASGTLLDLSFNGTTFKNTAITAAAGGVAFIGGRNLSFVGCRFDTITAGTFAVSLAGTINDFTFVGNTLRSCPSAISYGGTTTRRNVDLNTWDGGTIPSEVTQSALERVAGIALAGKSVAPQRLFYTGGRVPASSTDGTDTTPVTTETYYAEIFVPVNCTATGIAIHNGSAVAGSVVVALLNGTGTTIVAQSTGAGTTQVGTNVFQRVPFTAVANIVGPAKYHVLVQFNSASARFRTHPFGDWGADRLTGTTPGTIPTTGTVPAFVPPTAFVAGLGPTAALY